MSESPTAEVACAWTNRWGDRALTFGISVFAAATVAYWLAAANLVPVNWILPLTVSSAIALGYGARHTWSLDIAAQARPPRAEVRGTVAALSASAVAAALASIIVRPDADDYFYVNRSRWVAEQGSIARWNTIFGDQSVPMEPAYLLNSYETVLGLAASALGFDPASLTYAVVPPLASVAATWALWLLIRSWKLRAPDLAFALAFLGLLLGAVTNAAAANLFVGRMWQGKILFFAIVLPFIWSCAPRDPTRKAALLFACIAAVGLTTSAVFVVPPILLASAIAIAVSTRNIPVGPLAIGAPLLALAIFMPSTGANASERLELSGRGIVEMSLGTGVVLVLGMLAIAFGPRAVGSATHRMALYAASVFLLVGLSPPVLGLLERSGGSPVAWRMIWWLPTAALLGAMVTWTRLPRYVSIASTGLVTLALAIFGVPVWSEANGSNLEQPGAWKLPGPIRQQAEALIDLPDGSILLAPIWTSIGLSVSASSSFSIAGRSDYIESLHALPEFHPNERQILYGFMFGAFPSREQVGQALEIVGVTHVCAAPNNYSSATMLELDWVSWRKIPDLECFSRPP